jgi:hypothetical protein
LTVLLVILLVLVFFDGLFPKKGMSGYGAGRGL